MTGLDPVLADEDFTWKWRQLRPVRNFKEIATYMKELCRVRFENVG